MRPLTADVACDYLLGALPESQATALEHEAFETSARFDELQAFEAELELARDAR